MRDPQMCCFTECPGIMMHCHTMEIETASTVSLHGVLRVMKHPEYSSPTCHDIEYLLLVG